MSVFEKTPPPCTSSCASDVVEEPPIRTCCEVVETRTPDPLKYDQLISLEPAAPASEPQKKFPEASLFTSHPTAATAPTRSPPAIWSPPFVTAIPPPATERPPAKEDVAPPVEVNCPVTPTFVDVALVAKSAPVVIAVDDANGKRDALSVEVAIKYDATGVEEATKRVPSKARTFAVETVDTPVPPFATGRMPVTSEARFKSEEEMTPAVDLRTPVAKERKRTEFETVRAEVVASPETARLVEVARVMLDTAAMREFVKKFVEVAFVEEALVEMDWEAKVLVVVEFVAKRVPVVIAVDDANGKRDASVVEVAWMVASVMVDEPTRRVPSKASGSVEKTDAFVPPFAIGRIPETSVVREAWPEETTPEVVRRSPLESQLSERAFEITWREEDAWLVTAKSVEVEFVVRKLPKIPEVAKRAVEVAFSLFNV